MSLIKDFKDFAIKGNAVDLAVGVIIGGGFGKIVDSLVNDIILPMVSAVIGRLDFANLFLVLGRVPEGTALTLDALKKAGVPVFAYGSFITVVINFLLLAMVIFLMVRQLMRLRKQSESQVEPTAPPVAEDVLLLREIRDQLRENAGHRQ